MLTDRLEQLATQRDLLDVIVARQYTPYADPASRIGLAPGLLLQMYVLDADPVAHVAALLKLWRPAYGLTILDCGCGTGSFAAEVHRQRPDLRWWLLGQNREQLHHAARVAPCLQGDMHALPFAAASVDAVVLAYVLGYGFAPTVFEEVARVLKPGGQCVLYDMVTTDVPADRVLVSLGYKCYDVGRLSDYARTAGFRLRHEILFGTNAQIHPAVLAEGGYALDAVREDTTPSFLLWEKPA